MSLLVKDVAEDATLFPLVVEKAPAEFALDMMATGPTGPHPNDTLLGGTFDLLMFNATETGNWTTPTQRRCFPPPGRRCAAT